MHENLPVRRLVTNYIGKGITPPGGGGVSGGSHALRAITEKFSCIKEIWNFSCIKGSYIEFIVL